MHKVKIVSDQVSADELNELLEDDWWVYNVTPGHNGNWFVVLTDTDPDDLLLDHLAELDEEDDVDDYEEIEYERH